MAMVVNVFATNSTTDNLSRYELLAWVNETLQSDVRKVEDMCTGVVYCRLMNSLFPGSVTMKRVKVHANLEHEYTQNFKVLQESFTKMYVKKVIPVERLTKMRFQDNLEFLQWFKKFYDANVGARNGQTEQDAISRKSAKDTKSISSMRSTKSRNEKGQGDKATGNRAGGFKPKTPKSAKKPTARQDADFDSSDELSQSSPKKVQTKIPSAIDVKDLRTSTKSSSSNKANHQPKTIPLKVSKPNRSAKPNLSSPQLKGDNEIMEKYSDLKSSSEYGGTPRDCEALSFDFAAGDLLDAVAAKNDNKATDVELLNEIEKLKCELLELRLQNETLDNERTFYYDKLREIELILFDHVDEESGVMRSIANVIYKTDEGFSIPENNNNNNTGQ